MITATLFLVFAVITILGMPIALALVGGGMAAIVAGDLMPIVLHWRPFRFLCWLAH